MAMLGASQPSRMIAVGGPKRETAGATDVGRIGAARIAGRLIVVNRIAGGGAADARKRRWAWAIMCPPS